MVETEGVGLAGWCLGSKGEGGGDIECFTLGWEWNVLKSSLREVE